MLEIKWWAEIYQTHINIKKVEVGKLFQTKQNSRETKFNNLMNFKNACMP